MSDEQRIENSVALIGIGLLGTALAERLLRAGYHVHGHDVSLDAMNAFAALGGQAEPQLRDLPMAAHTIMLCLPDSDIVRQVTADIMPSLQPGTVLIDTTTGDPEATRNLAAQLAERDVSLVDASILGSSEATRRGEAVLMVGGSSDAFCKIRKVLEAVSDTIHHLGPVGSGQEMKLVANLVLGLNRAVLAEGLHFAKTFNLQPNVVLDVLKSGAAYSRVMDTKGSKMIEQEFAPQARLSQHLKDVNLMLDHAQKAQTVLPLSQVHQSLLKKVEAAGHGDLDNSAVIEAWSMLRRVRK